MLWLLRLPLESLPCFRKVGIAVKKLNYTLNHKADEAYMAKMCHEGWAATSLVEGIWTFEPCKHDAYTFRICYLRGKDNTAVEELKRSLAAAGIEFVSRYSFWAIFRSVHDFQLYTPEEELAICKTIRRPMLWGSVLSWLAAVVLLWLTIKISGWFGILCVLLAVYAVMCTLLGISYTRLIHKPGRKQI